MYLQIGLLGGTYVPLNFCISASTEATEMYHLSNFLFLRDQSVGAIFDYPKGMFHVLFIKNKNVEILKYFKYIGFKICSHYLEH